MRKFLKRMTGIFLCVAMAAGIYGAIPAYAEGTDTGTDIQEQAAQWPTGPAVQAASAIIMDASTGTVLYEKDADTPRYPASITKIIFVFETGLLSVSKNSFTAYRTAPGQSDML